MNNKLVLCQQTLDVQTHSSENVKISIMQSKKKCNKAAEFSDIYEQYNH